MSRWFCCLLILGLALQRTVFASPEAWTELAGHSGQPLNPQSPVRVFIVSPADGAVLSSHNVEVQLHVENYALAAGGNRLHLLLDNGAPLEITDLSKPIRFTELPEGGHCLRLLAVRPDGRALTNPESFLRTYFYVRRRNFQNFVASDAPLLTVNLPGNSPVDLPPGGRLWLDYLLLNAPLARTEAYRIRYKINGQESFVYDDRRIFWENLKPGRYDCEVELQQSDGTPLLGSFYLVRRTFLLRSVAKALAVGEAEPANAENAPATPHKPGHPTKAPKADIVGAPPN